MSHMVEGREEIRVNLKCKAQLVTSLVTSQAFAINIKILSDSLGAAAGTGKLCLQINN